MTSADKLPDSFLLQCCRYYETAGLTVRLAEPVEESPYYSLIVRFDDIGERGSIVDLELCFIPGLEPFAREGVYILQSFAVLVDRVPADKAPELLRATACVNMLLPLGAFGLYEGSGTLYLKHNTMVHRDWLTEETAVISIDRQNGLLLHQLHQYAERLIEVAEGNRTAESIV
ncbi:hypothetical protein FE783_16470 [Paenibacillus mesophilus]|uniref:hypothetical protein n=1 Tax=Paenibacillus mesophilus TaxID=2582849 RepID=UPI00110ECE01|nr:hypothetical protein [Paenibacillus mesophilus]TMV48648.1 hypothetical protein FE783_16470 [Paenibacillus mesophilus]